MFDLYTFPYHLPDSAYRPGLDYFLDRSTCSYNSVNTASGYGPCNNITLFKFVDFINPNEQQLYHWSVGDTIETYHNFNDIPVLYVTGGYIDYFLGIVSNAVTAGHSVSYTLSGSHNTCSSISDPCDLLLSPGVYTFYDTVYPFFDTSFLPESTANFRNYVFYFPGDTSLCSSAPAYALMPGEHFGRSGEDMPEPTWYKLGIGKTYFAYVDVEDFIWEYDGLAYTNINGIGCGTLQPTGINNMSISNYQCNIYPNPTATSLTITASEKITSVSISNTIGQTVYALDCNAEQVQINVSALPDGMYLVKINGAEVRRFVKE